MPKCRDNRKKRLKRRKKHEQRLQARPVWLCEDDDFARWDYEDHYDSPAGSCELCGTSLYEDDDVENELCDQCAWWIGQNNDGEQEGFQLVV